MAAVIAEPDLARIDATLGASTADGFSAGYQLIVHLGQSVVVLRSTTTQRLLTIANASGGVTPGGVCIPNGAEFARVRRELSAVAPGHPVDLSAWSRTATLVPVDLHLTPRHLDAGAIHAVSAELARGNASPAASFDGGLARVRSLAPALAEAAIHGDPRVLLPELIGAGPGTTPSGDDMVVGTLAALAARGLADAAIRLSAAVTPLLGATTAASRHYIVAAASGRFAEHVHQLVDGLVDGMPARTILACASRWGATSGVDLLTGLAATLRAELAHRTKGAA